MNAVLSFQIFTVFLFVLAIWTLIQLYREHRKESESQTKEDNIKILDSVESFSETRTMTLYKLIDDLLESKIEENISRLQKISTKKETTSSSKEVHP